jgi:steroid delta-isomerase-like uncharacterized protein
MGEARETMDRITQAIMAGDRDALMQLYAEDAVAVTPEGSLEGHEAIVGYLTSFQRAFPDLSWEATATFEIDDTAVDEGTLVGTHTETLSTPEGDVPATGRSIRLRECDVLTVRDGRATSHRTYYDRLDLTSQLGLDEAGAAVPAPRSGADQPSRTPAR